VTDRPGIVAAWLAALAASRERFERAVRDGGMGAAVAVLDDVAAFARTQDEIDALPEEPA
jgi:hypothetical protein